ncbi:hypothetical protein ZWY2020_015121 [Hordeum vulgare]|nr:hypothetical protein ZWY2020_015121 [Hordeum vulgare]
MTRSRRRLVKVPSVSRRRVGDFNKPDKADTPAGGSENVVEWKDIVAYDAVPAHPSTPEGQEHEHQQPVSALSVHPTTEQNSATFKLRSKSSKAPILPSQQDKPTRLRFRKRESSRRGQLQLQRRHPAQGKEPAEAPVRWRWHGLRLRGAEGDAEAQKTLEKKKSRRLSNNLIQETASKLAKSRVKSLVGAFETLISKIAK